MKTSVSSLSFPFSSAVYERGAGTGVAELNISARVPDLRGLCLLSFSSPHVDIEPQLLLLMDNIVLTGAWVLETDQTDQPR